MDNNNIVYMHIFPNLKTYIGITKRSPGERWAKGSGYKKQKTMYSAIKKYGWNNIKHIILFEGLTYDKACQIEKTLIEKFKSNQRQYGYNRSAGGEKSALGFKHTEEEKAKIKKNNAKYWLGKKRDYTTIEKMRAASRGNTNRRGKKNSEYSNQLNKEKHSIPVLQLLGKTIFKKYASAKEAELDLNISRGDITKVLKGKRKTAGGYNWEYANQ